MAKLTDADLQEQRRWNTTTNYNGWELSTKKDRMECVMSHEAIQDYAPQMGAMVGYAVTVEYRCADATYKSEHADAYMKLYEYLASIPGPKIIVARDLDNPNPVGSIFGEVTGNAYRALGCVGCIDDGFVRDVDEGAYGGFKMMARRLGVSHTYSCPVSFGKEIEVFGAKVKPGMLIHADKYGFIAIPEEDFPHLLEGVRFGDSNECQNTIPAARDVIGLSANEIVDQLKAAQKKFDQNIADFRKKILSE